MSEGITIEGAEPEQYEAVIIPIKSIKEMIRENRWKGSLEEEEILYDIQKGYYTKFYAFRVKKLLKKYDKEKNNG